MTSENLFNKDTNNIKSRNYIHYLCHKNLLLHS